MSLNRFDDDQNNFGYFTDWLFICESEIELVKLGFQIGKHYRVSHIRLCHVNIG